MYSFLYSIFLWTCTLTGVTVSAFEGQLKSKLSPWCKVSIDYSAANEFISEHYGDRVLKNGQSYFSQDTMQETIFNAREGCLIDGEIRRPKLTEAGFCLESNLPPVPSNMNYQSLHEVQEHYIPQLENIIRRQFESDTIEALVFYNPTLRRKGFSPTSREDPVNTPKSDVAGMAHIDADINAFGIDEFLNIVEKNALGGAFPPKVRDAIQSGRRFAVVNSWKNIASTPIQKAPLAFMPARYLEKDQAFPSGTLDREGSVWYTYPLMNNNEVLVFYQYDRDVRLPSDCWHCALKAIGIEDENLPDRESFDIRCLVLFPEEVESGFDRLSENRMTPLLSYDESAIFCTKQGEKRISDTEK